ncbi:MAG: rod-binding protein [Bdellovibrionales bacterium]|jgi:Rod binding domain-containing protein
MIEGVLPVSNDVTAASVLPMPVLKMATNARLDAVAQDFEAVFATQLLKPMFDTVPVNGLFGGGNGEEVMRSFLLQEYGKMIAQNGLLGIASQVKAEMLRAQEASKSRGEGLASPKAQKEKTDSTTKGTSYVSKR